MRPKKTFRNMRMGSDGRMLSDLNGCKIHSCSDLIVWPDRTEECGLCARDRQEDFMTVEQRKNVAFNLPPYWLWRQ